MLRIPLIGITIKQITRPFTPLHLFFIQPVIRDILSRFRRRSGVSLHLTALKSFRKDIEIGVLRLEVCRRTKS